MDIDEKAKNLYLLLFRTMYFNEYAALRRAEGSNEGRNFGVASVYMYRGDIV